MRTTNFKSLRTLDTFTVLHMKVIKQSVARDLFGECR
jgi:hypothetical protein